MASSADSAASLQPLIARFSAPRRRWPTSRLRPERWKRSLRRRGLFLAQVVVPEQRLNGGVIELRVLEGRLGNVSVHIQQHAI